MATRKPAAKPPTKGQVKAAADRAEATSKAKGAKPAAAKPPQTAAQPKAAGADPGAKMRPRLTGTNDLQNLLRRCTSMQKQQQSLSGEMGEMIAKAVETKFLHRKAFSIIRQCDRMEPEKLAEFLYNLDHYLEATGLRERAGAVGSLELGDRDDDSKADSKADEKPAPKEGTVSAPKTGPKLAVDNATSPPTAPAAAAAG